uniref:Uncharacterized protein n=1 Tax=viral metagenome TaxID=1070528 RepID=A0A6C0BKP8_9ZZZZ
MELRLGTNSSEIVQRLNASTNSATIQDNVIPGSINLIDTRGIPRRWNTSSALSSELIPGSVVTVRKGNNEVSGVLVDHNPQSVRVRTSGGIIQLYNPDFIRTSGNKNVISIPNSDDESVLSYKISSLRWLPTMNLLMNRNMTVGSLSVAALIDNLGDTVAPSRVILIVNNETPQQFLSQRAFISDVSAVESTPMDIIRYPADIRMIPRGTMSVPLSMSDVALVPIYQYNTQTNTVRYGVNIESPMTLPPGTLRILNSDLLEVNEVQINRAIPASDEYFIPLNSGLDLSVNSTVEQSQNGERISINTFNSSGSPRLLRVVHPINGTITGSSVEYKLRNGSMVFDLEVTPGRKSYVINNTLDRPENLIVV